MLSNFFHSSKAKQLLPFALHPLCLACTFANAAEEPIERDIEEVVILGEKMGKSIQDTAASVSVLTTAELLDQQIVDFYDVIERTPNVHIDGTRSQFSIRGVSAFGAFGAPSNNFLASVYLDGAPLAQNNISFGGAFSTWDMQQVEILRGPQSTLQGRNALAGAIHAVTTKPTDEFEVLTRLEAGSFDNRSAAVAVGGGLVDDVLAYRFTAEKREVGGYIDNEILGVKADASERSNYRAQFKVTPSSIDGLTVNLGYYHSDAEQGGLASTLEEGQTYLDLKNSGRLFDNRIYNTDVLTSFENESDLFIVNTQYELNEHLSLTSVTSYSQDDSLQIRDADNTSEPVFVARYGTKYASDIVEREDTTFAQEFRLNMNYGAFFGVGGVYFSALDVERNTDNITQFNFETLGAKNLLIGSLTGAGLPAAAAEQTADTVLGLYQQTGADPSIGDGREHSNQSVDTLAVFADITYQATDKLDILGGFRWDKERQSNQRNIELDILNRDVRPTPEMAAALNPALAPVIEGFNAELDKMALAAASDEPAAEDDFSAFLPKLGLSYHWNDDVTTSFVAQRGYRSGGVGTNRATGTPYVYDPEYTTNYELSLRSEWLDDTLTINANLYRVDWKDQQVSVQLSSNTFDQQIQNANESRLQGAELSVNYQVSDLIQVYAGLGISDTEFVDLELNERDLSGLEFAQAPRETGNIGVTYGGSQGFIANLNANYASASRQVIDPFFLSEDDANFDPRNDARTLVNARIGYDWGNYGVFLVANNLLDEEYVTSADTGAAASIDGGIVGLGAPRQFTLSALAKF